MNQSLSNKQTLVSLKEIRTIYPNNHKLVLKFSNRGGKIEIKESSPIFSGNYIWVWVPIVLVGQKERKILETRALSGETCLFANEMARVRYGSKMTGDAVVVELGFQLQAAKTICKHTRSIMTIIPGPDVHNLIY